MAKGVVPLVDEMLRCMCPPINPRLVENHAKALLQGVHGLVQLTQSTCGVQWPMLLLDEMNQHYQVENNRVLFLNKFTVCITYFVIEIICIQFSNKLLFHECLTLGKILLNLITSYLIRIF